LPQALEERGKALTKVGWPDCLRLCGFWHGSLSGGTNPLGNSRADYNKRQIFSVISKGPAFFHRPPSPHEYQFDLDTDAGQRAVEEVVAYVGGLAR